MVVNGSGGPSVKTWVIALRINHPRFHADQFHIGHRALKHLLLKQVAGELGMCPRRFPIRLRNDEVGVLVFTTLWSHPDANCRWQQSQ